MYGIEGRLVINVKGEMGGRGKCVKGSIDSRKLGGVIVSGR